MAKTRDFIIILELPLAAEQFGGMVGNRVILRENPQGVSCLTVQLAYLEKGEGTRVRYLEHKTPLVLAAASGVLARIRGVREVGRAGERAILELDIACE
jgi:hypothetical protein